MKTQRAVVAPCMDSVGRLRLTAVLDARAVMVFVEPKVLLARILECGNRFLRHVPTLEDGFILVEDEILSRYK